jgi:hypothetical protein
LFAGAIILPADASASTMDDVRFAVHRKDPTTKAATICTSYTPNAEGLTCYVYNTAAPAPGASLVYIMAVHGNWEGFLGASFGIDYNGRAGEGTGIDPAFTTFTPCYDGLGYFNDGGFGDFPAPRGGARVTWITCQDEPIVYEVNAVIGALYVYAYSADQLKITPNNNLDSGPELAVANCLGEEIQLLEIYPPVIHPYLAGWVDFGGGSGFTCFDLPVEKSTWGRVKTLFGGFRE